MALTTSRRSVVRRPTRAGLGGHEGLDQGPLRVGQVAGVGRARSGGTRHRGASGLAMSRVATRHRQ